MTKLEQIKALMMENGQFVVKEADIYLRDDRIDKIVLCSENSEIPAGYEKPDHVISGRNRLAIPGLINSHTHAYMTMFRNIADDVPFTTWLFDTIEPLEDAMTPEESYYGTLLGNIEMIRTGTTSYIDMYISPDVNAKAVKESGLRACLSRGIVGSVRNDEGGMRRINESIHDMETWCDGDRLSMMLAPHAPYSCNGDFLKQVCELAKERNMAINMHLAEGMAEIQGVREKYNMTPIEYAESMGVFDVRSVAAHCVYLEEQDYDILKAKGVNVAINPISNAKLANGFSPVVKMLEKGLNVCIGTDGAASNNTLNMFREMTFEAMIHKGLHKNAEAVSAQNVLQMATLGGARAMGREGDIGIIAEGAKADISIIDLRSPNLMPNNNIISSLVYSANGSEVETVIADGKILMENRELKTIDEERVYYEMEKIGARYMDIVSHRR